MTDTHPDQALPSRTPTETDLGESPGRTARPHATVAHMGNNSPAETPWFEKPTDSGGAPPAWHHSVSPAPAAPPPPRYRPTTPASPGRRPTWPYLAGIVALTIAVGGVWQHAKEEQRTEERQAKAAAYKGESGASFHVGDVDAEVVAYWHPRRGRVGVQLSSLFDKDAKYLRIEAGGKSASSVSKHGWYPDSPEIVVPIKDPLADLTVRVWIGDKSWKKGTKADLRVIRLSPTDVAYDADTGKLLKPN